MPSSKKKKLRLGVGAYCSVYTKFMHSKPTISAKYPNYTSNDRMTELNCIKREVRKVNRRDQMCAVFTHKDFDDVKFYCVLRYVVVTKEGPESELFPDDQGRPVQQMAAPSQDLDDEVEVPTGSNTMQDAINEMRAKGILVDDDNEPVVENMPTATDPDKAVYEEKLTGDVTGICNRRKEGFRFERAKMTKQPAGTTRLDYFRHFAPLEFFEKKIIAETNKHMGGRTSL